MKINSAKSRLVVDCTRRVQQLCEKMLPLMLSLKKWNVCFSQIITRLKEGAKRRKYHSKVFWHLLGVAVSGCILFDKSETHTTGKSHLDDSDIKRIRGTLRLIWKFPVKWEEKNLLIQIMVKYTREWTVRRRTVAGDEAKKSKATVPMSSPVQPAVAQLTSRPHSMFPDDLRESILNLCCYVTARDGGSTTRCASECSVLPRLRKFAELHKAGVTFSDRNLVNVLIVLCEAFSEKEIVDYNEGRSFVEEVYEFLLRRPVLKAEDKKLVQELRVAIHKMAEELDREAYDDHDVSPATTILYSDDNFSMAINREKSHLRLAVLNRKGFLEIISTVSNKLRESPPSVTRTIRMYTLSKEIIYIRDYLDDAVSSIDYSYEMLTEGYAAFLDLSSPSTAMEVPSQDSSFPDGMLTTFPVKIWEGVASLCRRVLIGRSLLTCRNTPKADPTLLAFWNDYKTQKSVSDEQMVSVALTAFDFAPHVCRNLIKDEDIEVAEQIRDIFAGIAPQTAAVKENMARIGHCLEKLKYAPYSAPYIMSRANVVLHADDCFTVTTNSEEKSHVELCIHKVETFVTRVHQTMKRLRGKGADQGRASLKRLVEHTVHKRHAKSSYRYCMYLDGLAALIQRSQTEKAKGVPASKNLQQAPAIQSKPPKGKKKVKVEQHPPKVDPYPAQTNKPRRFTAEDIKNHLAAAHSSAPFTLAQQVLTPPPAEKELPPPLECGICSLSIQPTEVEYYEYTCGALNKAGCVFPCHLACLHTRYKSASRRTWKGKKCPNEGCLNNMLVVHIVRTSLEPEMYVWVDGYKKDVQQLEKNQKKTLKKAKQQKSGGEKQRGRPPEPETAMGQVAIQTATPAAEGAMEHNSDSPSVGTVEEKMEQMRLLQQPVVPLAKERDETEAKYAVTDAAVRVKHKTKRKKNPLPIVFGSEGDAEDKFPGNIAGRVTFPLPGQPGSDIFQSQIIGSIAPFIEELPANCPLIGTLDSLLASLLLISSSLEGILSEPQVAYMREMVKLPQSNCQPLRQFIAGLRYFDILFIGNQWSYCKNAAGLKLSVEATEFPRQAQISSEVTQNVEKWLPTMEERTVEFARQAEVTVPDNVKIGLELVKELQTQRDVFDFERALRNVVERLGKTEAASGSVIKSGTENICVVCRYEMDAGEGNELKACTVCKQIFHMECVR